MKPRSLLVFLLTLVISGCTAPQPSDGVFLRVTAWGDVDEEAQLIEVLDEFREHHPDVMIVLEFAPPPQVGYGSGFIDGYEHRILGDYAANDPPDLMMFPALRWGHYAVMGAFYPLDEYLQDTSTELWPVRPINGVMYAVPDPTHRIYWSISYRTPFPSAAFDLLRHLVNTRAQRLGIPPLLGSKVDPFDQPVSFANFMLDQAVRSQLPQVRTWGPFEARDLLTITAIQSTCENLDGIEHLRNLEYLKIAPHSLRTIHQIRELTKLQWLTLSTARVPGEQQYTLTDFSPISNLLNLVELDLTNNGLRDIRFLSELEELRILNLKRNFIGDITPLQGLTRLSWLFLAENQVLDLSPLTHLPSLTHLDLSSNGLTSIRELGEVRSLYHLSLVNNQITDISPLGDLPNLDRVDLRGNPLDLRHESEAMRVIHELRTRGVRVITEPVQ